MSEPKNITDYSNNLELLFKVEQPNEIVSMLNWQDVLVVATKDGVYRLFKDSENVIRNEKLTLVDIDEFKDESK